MTAIIKMPLRHTKYPLLAIIVVNLRTPNNSPNKPSEAATNSARLLKEINPGAVPSLPF